MDFDHSSNRSPRVCQRCRRLKQKCDKTLPKCSSCTKSFRKCLYPDQSSISSPSPTKVASVAIESPSAIHGVDSSDFPPIYFLDFQLFQRTVSEMPRISPVIPSELQGMTEDIREQAKIYFHNIHPWLPFLSKKSFNERLLNPLNPRTLDVVLLFSCMKLVNHIPYDENVRTTEYLTVKHALLQAEVSGLLTLRVLQAWILLCVYEIGHAIYPSAYLSIGTCAKYALAMGMTKNEQTTIGQSSSWIEAEERIRAWWAIIILDRYSNIGCPGRSLSIDDPAADTILPIDDISWDEGIQKPNVATLSTPPTPLMGRYALMAQGASLLGRVYRHVCEKNNEAFSKEEAIILDRTLAALTIVANEEGAARGIGVCTPTVICHSARIMLILHNRSRNESIDIQRIDPGNKIVNCGVAHDMVRLSQWAVSEVGHQIDDEISPFPLNVAYYAAISYLEMYYEQHNLDSFEGISHLKAMLEFNNMRWKAAGEYLKLIQAREAMYINAL